MRARTKWAAVAALVVLLASVSAVVTTAFAPPRGRAVAPGPQRVAADSVAALPLRGDETGPARPGAALPVRPPDPQESRRRAAFRTPGGRQNRPPA